MISIGNFLRKSIFVEWYNLDEMIIRKLERSIHNHILYKYNRQTYDYYCLHNYIYALSHVVFTYVDKNKNLFIIGQVDCNYDDYNIKGYWFIMTTNKYSEITFKLYDTLRLLIVNLDTNQKLILKSHIQIRYDSAIKIQKYFKGWKARMKYRYNPETRLCKFLLKKEFTEL